MACWGELRPILRPNREQFRLRNCKKQDYRANASWYRIWQNSAHTDWPSTCACLNFLGFWFCPPLLCGPPCMPLPLQKAHALSRPPCPSCPSCLAWAHGGKGELRPVLCKVLWSHPLHAGPPRTRTFPAELAYRLGVLEPWIDSFDLTAVAGLYFGSKTAWYACQMDNTAAKVWQTRPNVFYSSRSFASAHSDTFLGLCIYIKKPVAPFAGP